jgi:hypothetical protein
MLYMNKLILSLFILMISLYSFSQDGCMSKFEGSTYQICNLSIDTISNPNNIWEIGIPQKIIFDSASSLPNAIVTNLTNSYSINDTSYFTITHIAGMGFWMGHTFGLSFDYFVDTDSLNDYGIIEFSPDNGNTWCNLTNNSNNCFSWWSFPTLTGSNNSWMNAEAMINFNSFNITQGDTLKFKFTFLSDSIYDNKDGLMFDNIFIEDSHESINESTFIKSTSHPNPTNNSILIEFDNYNHSQYELNIYDNLGRKVHKSNFINDKKIDVDVRNFKNGIYHYTLFCPTQNLKSIGKFIKN